MIVIDRVDQAEPILAIVNLDALKTGEAIVGFDKRFDNFGCRSAVRPDCLHVRVRIQPSHDGGGIGSLELAKFGVGLTLAFHDGLSSGLLSSVGER